ncbi:MAG: 2-octaprenyl-6-methoxyphenyl hydroxylase, partial [Gammaproteobacteria bacterium]
MTDYDLLIVGGGMVGASLACALGGQPLRVAVAEAVPFDAPAQPSYDDRAIALAAGTRRIFEGMGLWPALCDGLTAIHHIHVSDRGRFGFAHIDRREQGVEALGYVAPARVLGGGIGSRLRELSTVDVICPARVESVQP